MNNLGSDKERRGKHRFEIRSEVRFKVLESERVAVKGVGQTLNLSSGGVAFETTTKLDVGTLLELSVSWPVLLEETCLMQLVVFGHVVRIRRQVVACTVDRYEFRTQARAYPTPARAEVDSTLRRWVENSSKTWGLGVEN